MSTPINMPPFNGKLPLVPPPAVPQATIPAPQIAPATLTRLVQGEGTSKEVREYVESNWALCQALAEYYLLNKDFISGMWRDWKQYDFSKPVTWLVIGEARLSRMLENHVINHKEFYSAKEALRLIATRAFQMEQQHARLAGNVRVWSDIMRSMHTMWHKEQCQIEEERARQQVAELKIRIQALTNEVEDITSNYQSFKRMTAKQIRDAYDAYMFDRNRR